jgi:TonB family protein
MFGNETTLFGILVTVAVKSTIVLGAAWLATLAMRRQSAAARHLVWTAAAAALLALPVLSVALPSLPVPVAKAIDYGVLFRANATADAGMIAAQPARPRPVAAKPHARPFESHWRLIAVFLWAAGSLLAFFQMLIALARTRKTRRAFGPSAYSAEAAEIAGELGIRNPVDVLESPAGAMPMTFGILRPVVFLPRDASEWTDDLRRVVLLHELAHVRRGDVPAQLMARLALILHWWNPLAWTAWRAFLAERERATDDLVLRAGAPASDYAGHLLEIARASHSGPALGSASVAMARRSQLEGRLLSILDARVNRNPVGCVSPIAVVLAALVLMAPLAAVRAQEGSPGLPPVPSAGLDATIRAAVASKNSEMLEKPATAFEELHQYDVARKLLDSAVAIREQVSGDQSEAYGLGLLKIGDLESKRNRSSEAESFYTKAVGVLGDRPETAPALLYLGILSLNKDAAVAVGDFQKAQTLDSSLAGPAKMWTALAEEGLGNAGEAETMYRAALAAETPDSADAADTSTLLARFLEKQGRAQEATPFTAQANAVRAAIYEKHTPKPEPNALRAGRDGVTLPKVLSKVDPAYTVGAKAVKDNGSVLLRLEIGPDGAEHNVHIVKGLGFGLDEAAIAAVSQWRFEPATKDGAPVTVQATIEVNFRLL